MKAAHCTALSALHGYHLFIMRLPIQTEPSGGIHFLQIANSDQTCPFSHFHKARYWSILPLLTCKAKPRSSLFLVANMLYTIECTAGWAYGGERCMRAYSR